MFLVASSPRNWCVHHESNMLATNRRIVNRHLPQYD